MIIINLSFSGICSPNNFDLGFYAIPYSGSIDSVSSASGLSIYFVKGFLLGS